MLRILHRAFDLALRSPLPLERFVAGQVVYSMLDLAFGLVMTWPNICLCWCMIRRIRYFPRTFFT